MNHLKIAKEKWIEDAKSTPWDIAAEHLPTKWKKSGSSRTSIDGCPFCGGRDRLSYDISKKAWICRGHGGGYDPVGLVMHGLQLSFQEACELLTGRANPYGDTAPLSEEEKRKREEQRDKAREKAEAKLKAEEEEAALSDKRKFEYAKKIWSEVRPIAGTAAERYLNNRGTYRSEWSSELGYHPGLTYSALSGKPKFPALVARVSDMFGDFLGVWRIYITEDGHKAPVPSEPGCKIGLGRVEGGAVWLHGTGESSVIAGEGLETTLALEDLFCLPGVATLSTSGMIGLDPPIDLETAILGADGDFMSYSSELNKWSPAPGRAAAQKSRENLIENNIDVTAIYEPPSGFDWEDVRNLTKERVSA